MLEVLNSPGHEKLDWTHTHTSGFNIIHVTLAWKLRRDKEQNKWHKSAHDPARQTRTKTTSHQRLFYLTQTLSWFLSLPQVTAIQTRAASGQNCLCVWKLAWKHNGPKFTGSGGHLTDASKPSESVKKKALNLIFLGGWNWHSTEDVIILYI